MIISYAVESYTDWKCETSLLWANEIEKETKKEFKKVLFYKRKLRLNGKKILVLLFRIVCLVLA